MKISLFLNTRKRTRLLANLLYSIYNTAHNADNIEVFVTIDRDDEESKDFLQQLDVQNLSFRQIERPTNLHVSINQMAEMSSGDFLFVLNDDVIFRTFNWDINIIDNYNPEEILYIATHDNSVDKTNHGRYSSFPILTRAAYDKLGFFMSEKFVCHGADAHLWRIFDSINAVEYSEIFLDHVLHSTAQGLRSIANEETAQQAIKMTFDNFVNCWDEDISEEVSKLNDSKRSQVLKAH